MCAVCALMPVGAQAQPFVEVDTLTITESTTMSYDGQIVDYFLLDVGESQLGFIEDSAYVKLLGFIEQGDTMLFPEAVVWMKTTDPEIGDSWVGMLPNDELTTTSEEIVGIKMVNVEAGSFQVYEIGVHDTYGRYLGEKWWSDGVGLIGWDITICNESEVLELQSYDLSGGGAFWPHEVGDSWVFQSSSDATFSQAPVAAITVDGFGGDWTGLSPMVQDTSGDDATGFAGADIRNVLAAVDGSNLYLMATFWDGAPDTNWAIANDPAYAFVFDDDGLGNFWGYAIGYASAPASTWVVDGLNMMDVGATVAVGNVIEVSVPLTDLGFYQFQLPYFAFAVDSGLYDVSCYNDVRLQASCPVSLTGDVQNDLNLSSADIVYMVNFVLKAGPPPIPCPAVGDVNCNGGVSTSDIIYLVNRVFKAGPDPCDVCALIPVTWTCP